MYHITYYIISYDGTRKKTVGSIFSLIWNHICVSEILIAIWFKVSVRYHKWDYSHTSPAAGLLFLNISFVHGSCIKSNVVRKRIIVLFLLLRQNRILERYSKTKVFYWNITCFVYQCNVRVKRNVTSSGW